MKALPLTRRGPAASRQPCRPIAFMPRLPIRRRLPALPAWRWPLKLGAAAAGQAGCRSRPESPARQTGGATTAPPPAPNRRRAAPTPDASAAGAARHRREQRSVASGVNRSFGTQLRGDGAVRRAPPRVDAHDARNPWPQEVDPCSRGRAVGSGRQGAVDRPLPASPGSSVRRRIAPARTRQRGTASRCASGGSQPAMARWRPPPGRRHRSTGRWRAR